MSIEPLLVLGPIAAGCLIVVATLWSARSCPSCKASKVYWIGATTFDDDPQTYRVFRCAKCDLELIADRRGRFHRRETWRPAPGALPRAVVRRPAAPSGREIE